MVLYDWCFQTKATEEIAYTHLVALPVGSLTGVKTQKPGLILRDCSHSHTDKSEGTVHPQAWGQETLMGCEDKNQLTIKYHRWHWNSPCQSRASRAIVQITLWNKDKVPTPLSLLILCHKFLTLNYNNHSFYSVPAHRLPNIAGDQLALPGISRGSCQWTSILSSHPTGATRPSSSQFTNWELRM